MYRQEFNELWDKTATGVMFNISAKNVRGKAMLNETLKSLVWNHAWGNKKLVPPERKLLNDIAKDDPHKSLKLEKVLSEISVGNDWGLWGGIILILIGIITVAIIPGMWKMPSVLIAVLGLVLSVYSLVKYNINPKKYASRALDVARDKCNSILS